MLNTIQIKCMGFSIPIVISTRKMYVFLCTKDRMGFNITMRNAIHTE